ncbi:MAG TPA: glycerophosphodiester phosphodiesterase family protein [Bryobacteraceae bacterium]|nr:glycerophosphodiester phosphodiesterase family protein [Bryobacteraceae bacterium]
MRFAVAFALCTIGLAAQDRHVVAIAHRGEHLHHPENTIPAFEEAIRDGADFIEVDVRTSSDGKLVLSHDATVDRRTNGKGKVSDMTLDQLELLDAGGGAKIPAFDQALDLARGKIGIYVDVKNAMAQDLVHHIDDHGMRDNVVIYCGLALAKQIQALDSKLKVMPEASSVEHAKQLVDELHPVVLAYDAKDFTLEIIAVAKQAGAKIYVDRLGAADNEASWLAAIEAGADGIQTDHPAELVEFLRKRLYK